MPSSDFPVDDPLADLAPVARKIVDAATHLIARAGLKGFTLTAVAAEAGVYADSIRYYFGGIGGLLETIVSSLSHVTSFRALESLGAIDERGRRSQALAEAGLDVAEEEEQYRVFWEVVPRVLGDEVLRKRMAKEYEWYRELYLRDFPERPTELRQVPDQERARTLSSLMVAIIDGLALQKSLDPDHVDLGAAFAMWAEIVAPALERELALHSQ